MLINHEFIENVRKIYLSSKDLSESGTILHFIMPLFEQLGWKLGMNENIIFEESTATNKRVDIKFVSQNYSFLLEAKKLNLVLTEKDFEQLTNYVNSDHLSDFGILTNGIDYWIADNRKNGLLQKRIYKFDILKLSNCDQEVISCFEFPLLKLHELIDLINYQEFGKKIGKIKCEQICEINQETKITIEVSQNNNLINLEEFDKLNKDSFKYYSYYFIAKIYIALKIIEDNKYKPEDLFAFLPSLFRKEKLDKYSMKYLEKYQIWLYLNLNNAQKDDFLQKIRNYLLKILK